MPGQVPSGGVCISSFIVAEKEGKILLGKTRNPEISVERFLVGCEFAPGTRRQENILEQLGLVGRE